MMNLKEIVGARRWRVKYDESWADERGKPWMREVEWKHMRIFGASGHIFQKNCLLGKEVLGVWVHSQVTLDHVLEAPGARVFADCMPEEAIVDVPASELDQVCKAIRAQKRRPPD